MYDLPSYESIEYKEKGNTNDSQNYSLLLVEWRRVS